MTQYVVNSGQTRTGLILGSNDTALVNGGTIVDTVNSGGVERLNGGNASGTKILAGGLEGVYFGGVASGSVIEKGRQEVYQARVIGTVIQSGGVQSLFLAAAGNDVVDKGGVVSSVYSDFTGLKIKGGHVDLLPNSTAESAVVGSGGILEVDGGTTSGTFQYKFATFDSAAVTTGSIVQSGGLLRVAGGVTSNSVIQAGGLETVFVSGSDPARDTGTSDGTTVLSGGEQDVSSGAIADKTLVEAGGILSVSGSAAGGRIEGSETVFGTATGDTVLSGGLQQLYGSATGTILDAAGFQDDFGLAAGTVIHSGGSQLVLGTATGTIVNSGGVQNVNRADGDFGVASGSLLHSGASQVVLGGTAVQTVIEAGATGGVDDGIVDGARIEGGTLTLEGDTTVATGVIVDSGGLFDVTAGTVSGTMVNSGGVETMTGQASGETIRSGGLETVFGSATGSVIDGGTLMLAGGGVGRGLVVNSGGELDVVAGTVSGTMIHSGGFETVSDQAINDTVYDGGLQLLYGIASGTILDQGAQTDLGQAFDTVIDAGGTQAVFGTATGTIVNSGGTQDVSRADGDFGVASGTLLHSGASQIVLGGSTVQTVIETGAVESVSDGTVDGTRIDGGTLVLETGSVATDGIRFYGVGGSLQLQGLSLPGTTIFGFGSTDSIDLEGYGYQAGASASLGANNLLSIAGLTGGNTTLALDPAANYAGKLFTLTSDGNGGSLLSVRDVPVPVASNESYSLLENTRLSVNVRNGVLVNDTDADNHVLSAAVVGSPLHGRVTMNRNGSFDYTPVKGFLGKDSFTYRATDGTTTSNLATVSLNVKLPVTAAAAADPLGLAAAFTANSGVTAASNASASLPETGGGFGHAALLLAGAGAAAVDPVPVLPHHTT